MNTKLRVDSTRSLGRPALAVDCAVLGFDGEDLVVLLVERDLAPFRGRWALPGGFVRMGETLEDAARRELREEAGIEVARLEQLLAFGALDRDPRGRVVSVAHSALVRLSSGRVVAATDARRAAWFAVRAAPRLAFDHGRMLALARERLRAKARREPIGLELLPRKFAFSELQRLYEAVLGRPLDRRNFRKKALALGIVEELDEAESGVAHRAGRLFRFDRARYAELGRSELHFEI